MHIEELGVTKDMLETIANQVSSNEGAYLPLTPEIVMNILKESW